MEELEDRCKVVFAYLDIAGGGGVLLRPPLHAFLADSSFNPGKTTLH